MRGASVGWRAAVVVMALATAVLPSCDAQERRKIVVGILPTYDLSGQGFGPIVTKMMTEMVYEKYAANPLFSPVYLNPGGDYLPSSGSYTADYLQTVRQHFDVVVATIFTEPLIPDRGNIVLHLKSTALDQKTGDTLTEWVVDKVLKDKSVLDYGRPVSQLGITGEMILGPPAREFRKQPLGKAALDLAALSVEEAAKKASGWPVSEAASAPGQGSCAMRMKVNYEERHTVSKSYSITINDRDEALGIKEGVLAVQEPAGKVQIRLSVMDKPRRMPGQTVYLLDPILDCTRSDNFLDINLGPAGEAHAVWH